MRAQNAVDASERANGATGTRPPELAANDYIGRKSTMTSERERRDFDAGLSEEVDAWLRGDPTRRTFLKHRPAAARSAIGFDARSCPAGHRPRSSSRRSSSPTPITPLGTGPGRGAEGLDRGTGGRLGLSRRRRPPSSTAASPQHDLRGGPAGARSAQLLGPAVGAADRHQVERRRAAASRTVFEADRRAHRRVRRLRRPRLAAGVDARRSPTAA